MRYTRTITAAWEPLTIEEARTHLRLKTTGGSHPDDSYVLKLVSAARETLEHDTKRCILTSTFLGYLHTFPAGDIIIQQSPVSEVSKIEYKSSSAWTEWSTAKWESDVISNPARVCPVDGESYPSEDTTLNAVKITFAAGYANASAVPDQIKQAIERLIGHWYENRQEVVTGLSVSAVPMGYDDMVRRLSVDRF